jgi:hypothetical protein
MSARAEWVARRASARSARRPSPSVGHRLTGRWIGLFVVSKTRIIARPKAVCASSTLRPTARYRDGPTAVRRIRAGRPLSPAVGAPRPTAVRKRPGAVAAGGREPPGPGRQHRPVPRRSPVRLCLLACSDPTSPDGASVRRVVERGGARRPVSSSRLVTGRVALRYFLEPAGTAGGRVPQWRGTGS